MTIVFNLIRQYNFIHHIAHHHHIAHNHHYAQHHHNIPQHHYMFLKVIIQKKNLLLTNYEYFKIKETWC